MQPTPPIIRGQQVREDGRVDLETGVALEFKLSQPPTSPAQSGQSKLAVCLHPWSWLGGRMNDPVLSSLKEVFHEQGYHVLRYNFRGVGRSSGRPTFTGIEEGRDLEAIVRWATQELPNVSTVVVVGYSYGSLIATLHPTLLGTMKSGYVLLSYPLGPRPFLTLFKGSYYDQRLDDLISTAQSKILVAFGGCDEFTSFDRYKTWAAQLEEKATRAASKIPLDDETKLLKIVSVPAASHFWTDESNDELCTELSEWLALL